MNYLFPIAAPQVPPDFEKQGIQEVKFGRSWRFDFEKGEFVRTPTGKVAGCEGVDAWMEWCKKAINTERYKYLVYSRNYGQEFEDLISRQLSISGNESEIQRIVTETLMVDPRTASVSNFSFSREGDSVFFSCEISNVRGETARISSGGVII